MFDLKASHMREKKRKRKKALQKNDGHSAEQSTNMTRERART